MGTIFTEWIVFHYHYLFLVAGLLLLGCTFILVRRFIDWAVEKGRVYFFSYIVGSLLFLNLFFFILIIGNEEAQAHHFLPYLLQIIGLYGLLLITGLGIKSLYQYVVSKKA